MFVRFPEAKSPPVHVYVIGRVLKGCALAIPAVPTNPVDTATIMAAQNRIRDFILAPFVCCVSPEAPQCPRSPSVSPKPLSVPKAPQCPQSPAQPSIISSSGTRWRCRCSAGGSEPPVLFYSLQNARRQARPTRADCRFDLLGAGVPCEGPPSARLP